MLGSGKVSATLLALSKRRATHSGLSWATQLSTSRMSSAASDGRPLRAARSGAKLVLTSKQHSNQARRAVTARFILAPANMDRASPSSVLNPGSPFCNVSPVPSVATTWRDSCRASARAARPAAPGFELRYHAHNAACRRYVVAFCQRLFRSGYAANAWIDLYFWVPIAPQASAFEPAEASIPTILMGTASNGIQLFEICIFDNSLFGTTALVALGTFGVTRTCPECSNSNHRARSELPDIHGFPRFTKQIAVSSCPRARVRSRATGIECSKLERYERSISSLVRGIFELRAWRSATNRNRHAHERADSKRDSASASDCHTTNRMRL